MTNGLLTPPRKGTITLPGFAELIGGAPTPEIPGAPEIPGPNTSVTVTPGENVNNLTQTINTQTPPILNTPPPSDVVTSTPNDVPVVSTEEIPVLGRLNAFQRQEVLARYGSRYADLLDYVVPKVNPSTGQTIGYDTTIADQTIATNKRAAEAETNWKRTLANQTNTLRKQAIAIGLTEIMQTGSTSDATRSAIRATERADNLAQAIQSGATEEDISTMSGPQAFLLTKTKDDPDTGSSVDLTTFFSKVPDPKAIEVISGKRFTTVQTQGPITAFQLLSSGAAKLPKPETTGLPQTPKSPAPPSPSDIIKNLPKPEVPAAPTGSSLFGLTLPSVDVVGLITGAATAPAKYIVSEAKKPTSAGQVIARAGAEAGLSPILSPVSYIVNSFASLFARR